MTAEMMVIGKLNRGLQTPRSKLKSQQTSLDNHGNKGSKNTKDYEQRIRRRPVSRVLSMSTQFMEPKRQRKLRVRIDPEDVTNRNI